MSCICINQSLPDNFRLKPSKPMFTYLHFGCDSTCFKIYIVLVLFKLNFSNYNQLYINIYIWNKWTIKTHFVMVLWYSGPALGFRVGEGSGLLRVACGLCSCAAVEYEHKHLIILVTENGFRCRLLLARESAVFLFQKRKKESAVFFPVLPLMLLFPIPSSI